MGICCGRAFFYNTNLVAALIAALTRKLQAAGRELRIKLLTDESLPNRLHEPGLVESFASTFEQDFLRIALSDFVVSNQSTFSATEALTGTNFLSSGCHYFSLGTAVEALDSVEKLTLPAA